MGTEIWTKLFFLNCKLKKTSFNLPKILRKIKIISSNTELSVTFTESLMIPRGISQNWNSPRVVIWAKESDIARGVGEAEYLSSYNAHVSQPLDSNMQ